MAEALRTEVRRYDEIIDWLAIGAMRDEYLDRQFGWEGFWPAPTKEDANPNALHVLTFYDREGEEELVGAARITPAQEVGRWLVGRVVSKYQKQGIGSATYSRAEYEAIERGATNFWLEATPLDDTVTFYENRGYHLTGEVKNCPGARGDVCCKVMTKDVTRHG